MQRPYVGRYAPSPTGRLHDGNLRTAALAWADARAHGGRFLLRIEDLDTPRVVPGAADQALRDLEALGLDWDGPVWVQSARIPLYEDALDALRRQGLAYPCRCSRKDIRDASGGMMGIDGLVYPGTCRGMSQEMLQESLPEHRGLAWRMNVEGDAVQTVVDRRRGELTEDLRTATGDFVLKRVDGLFAYQLACVVDDVASGITQIVRGEDLLSSCSRQQRLWRALGAPLPGWLHLPLAVDEGGQKISKRHRRWTDEPVDGPACLGRYAADLGWLPLAEGEASPPLSAAAFLDLYRARGWRLEAP